jgi:hypothetical protein
MGAAELHHLHRRVRATPSTHREAGAARRLNLYRALALIAVLIFQFVWITALVDAAGATAPLFVLAAVAAQN